MMHKITAATAVAANLLWSPAPVRAEAIAGSVFKVGEYWQGSAYISDDGQFSYCSVEIVHAAGQHLFFLMDREDTFHVATLTTLTSFTPGEEFETLVSINAGEPFRAFAWATDAQNLLMSFRRSIIP